MWPSEGCHDVTSPRVCVSHAHAHTGQTLPPLRYPSLDSAALFPSQHDHISSPPNTPGILRSQPSDNKGEIPLLEEERRGFLLSPVPSVVKTAVRALLIGILIFWNRSERQQQNGESDTVAVYAHVSEWCVYMCTCGAACVWSVLVWMYSRCDRRSVWSLYVEVC